MPVPLTTMPVPTSWPTLLQGKALEVGPLNYLFMHVNEPGAYCLGVFDNGYQGTLLGGITFRNILVQVGHPWSVRSAPAS